MLHITKIANTAYKNIKDLNPEIQKTIIESLDALQLNPFDQDIKKIGACPQLIYPEGRKRRSRNTRKKSDTARIRAK